MTQTGSRDAPHTEIANAEKVSVGFGIACCSPDLFDTEHSISAVAIAPCQNGSTKESSIDFDLGCPIPFDVRYITFGHPMPVCTPSQILIGASNEVATAKW